ncbi:hypothetical protein, partial [Actinomadura sp. 7K534]|uniref:hypothetical protein n=1 Tax=Actinomadura sp. 7K534 TaxID=2530366 RepID=UPI001A9E399A
VHDSGKAWRDAGDFAGLGGDLPATGRPSTSPRSPVPRQGGVWRGVAGREVEAAGGGGQAGWRVRARV